MVGGLFLREALLVRLRRREDGVGRREEEEGVGLLSPPWVGILGWTFRLLLPVRLRRREEEEEEEGGSGSVVGAGGGVGGLGVSSTGGRTGPGLGRGRGKVEEEEMEEARREKVRVRLPMSLEEEKEEEEAEEMVTVGLGEACDPSDSSSEKLAALGLRVRAGGSVCCLYERWGEGGEVGLIREGGRALSLTYRRRRPWVAAGCWSCSPRGSAAVCAPRRRGDAACFYVGVGGWVGGWVAGQNRRTRCGRGGGESNGGRRFEGGWVG